MVREIDSFEAELAPTPILSDTLEDAPDRPLQGEPSEEDDQRTWKLRDPQRVLRLPFLFSPTPGEWTREVRILPMDGRCEDILTDDSGTYTDRHARMNEVLSRCVESMGSFERPANAKPESDGSVLPRFFVKALEDMPLPNRIVLIVRLRQLSCHLPTKGLSGHEFSYSDTCPHCDKFVENLSVRLDTLPIKEVDDEFCRAEKHVYNDGRYEIEWRVPRGSDEPKMHKVKTERRADFLTGILFISTLTINGKQPKRFDDIKALPKATRDALRDEMDCGGMDISIVTQCPNPACRKEYQRPVPWEQKGFFFPSRQR